MLIFLMIIVPIVATFLADGCRAYDPKHGQVRLKSGDHRADLAFGWQNCCLEEPRWQNSVAKDYPVAAVQYLRQHPQPTGMFNDYSYGGYLIWQLGPQQKVFIDGRADMYEYSGVFQDYAATSPIWRAMRFPCWANTASNPV